MNIQGIANIQNIRSAELFITTSFLDASLASAMTNPTFSPDGHLDSSTCGHQEFLHPHIELQGDEKEKIK